MTKDDIFSQEREERLADACRQINVWADEVARQYKELVKQSERAIRQAQATIKNLEALRLRFG